MPEFIYDPKKLPGGARDPWPIKFVDNSGQIVWKVSPNEALELAKNLVEMVDAHYCIEPSTVRKKSVRQSYRGGACPDCGYKLPKGAHNGSACPNCDHVFHKEG